MWQVWCSSIQDIYAGLMGVSICHAYMCIVLYMKLIQCNGLAEIYDQLEEGGVGLLQHRYMCILLFVKLIECNGVA